MCVCVCVCVCVLVAQLFFATPWTVALQAPWCVGFPRQEYWSGLPFPSPGDLPHPGIEPGSLALQVDSLPLEPDQRARCIYASLWVLWSVAVIEFYLLEHMSSPLGLEDTEFEAICNFLKDYSNYQNTFYRMFSMKLLLN